MMWYGVISHLCDRSKQEPILFESELLFQRDMMMMMMKRGFCWLWKVI